MIISQDGHKSLISVNEVNLLEAGSDYILTINHSTYGKFKNKAFAEETLKRLFQFLATGGKGLFEVPADF